MKKLLMAAVLVLAACGEKKAEGPAVDTSASVIETPASDTFMPPVDSGMSHDSAVHSDSTVARDSGAAH